MDKQPFVVMIADEPIEFPAISSHEALLFILCLAAELAPRNGQISDALPSTPVISEHVWKKFAEETRGWCERAIVIDSTEERIVGGRDFDGQIWGDPPATEIVVGFARQPTGALSVDKVCDISEKNSRADRSETAQRQAKESQVETLKSLMQLCDEHKHPNDKAPVHQ